jgi:hypothetical protein
MGIFQEDHWCIWHCLRLSHFPKLWKEAKVITLSKPCKDPKFSQNLLPISHLSTTGQQLRKVVVKIVQKQIEYSGLLNASLFGFCVRHSTTLQYMKFTDHVTLNFNNNMYTAAVFLDIEKVFGTIWHLGFLYKLSNLKCSISLIRLISTFPPHRNLKISVEGEISMPRYIRAGVPKVSVLFPTL